MKVPFYFGGTALLIVVGVALDTDPADEPAPPAAAKYDGFMKKGRVALPSDARRAPGGFWYRLLGC